MYDFRNTVKNIMKRYTYFLFVLFIVNVASAQIRGLEPRNPSVQNGVVKAPTGNLLFGLIDPDKFQMNHSVSVQYMNMGGQSVGLSMYTNSMRYQISDPLSIRADVSMVYSPFSSFGNSFQKDISGIYLNRAQIDYQPSNNFRISLQYRNLPSYQYQFGGLRGYNGGWGMYHDDGF